MADEQICFISLSERDGLPDLEFAHQIALYLPLATLLTLMKKCLRWAAVLTA